MHYKPVIKFQSLKICKYSTDMVQLSSSEADILETS